jgi:hypothetical protein
MDHFNEQKKAVATLVCSLFNESSKTCRNGCWAISNTAGPKAWREYVGRILAIGHDLDRTIKSRNELEANVLRRLTRA